MGATLILVNGHSASGKTVLARWLGEQLGVPVTSKDFYKERLYDERAPVDREESREYGQRLCFAKKKESDAKALGEFRLSFYDVDARGG